MTAGRFMYSIMCDDVRREEGNKLSFMGIYGASLVVPAFPIALPKLCFVMSVLSPGDANPPASLIFRLFSNDQVLSEVPIPPESLSAMPLDAVQDRESKRLNVTSVMQLLPVAFTEPCILKARAWWDDEELKGGSWQVERAQ